MGIINDKFKSLKSKWKIQSLSDESQQIIKKIEKLDEQEKTIAINQLDELLKKTEQLLILESRRVQDRIDDKLNDTSTNINKSFDKLSIDSKPNSFSEAIEEAKRTHK